MSHLVAPPLFGFPSNELNPDVLPFHPELELQLSMKCSVERRIDFFRKRIQSLSEGLSLQSIQMKELENTLKLVNEHILNFTNDLKGFERLYDNFQMRVSCMKLLDPSFFLDLEEIQKNREGFHKKIQDLKETVVKIEKIVSCVKQMEEAKKILGFLYNS